MTQPPANLLLRIEQLLNAGKLQEARLLLVDFIQSNPNSARAWWLLSLTLADVDRQVACLKRVLRLDPENKLARERLTGLNSQLKPLPSTSPFTSSFMGETETSADDITLIPEWARPMSTGAAGKPPQPTAEQVESSAATSAPAQSQEPQSILPAIEPEIPPFVKPVSSETPKLPVELPMPVPAEVASITPPGPIEPLLVSPVLSEIIEPEAAVYVAPEPREPEVTATLPVEPVEQGPTSIIPSVPVEPESASAVLTPTIATDTISAEPAQVSRPDEPAVTPPVPVEAEAIAAESTPEPPVPVEAEAIILESTPVSGPEESIVTQPAPIEPDALAAQSTLVSGADKSIVTLPAPAEAETIIAESTLVSGADESIITLPAVVEAAAITTAPAPASGQDTSPTTPLAALKSEPVPNAPDFPVGSEASSTKHALFSELDKSFYAPPIPLEAASSAPPPPPPVETRKPLIKPAASAEAVASPPKPPAPIKPSTAAALPRSPSSKWEIVYILLAGFLILATVAVVGYISIQKKVQAQALALATARDLQQTLVIAQTLTNLPLPTLIPTWTPSPSSTGLPTFTFTSSPTAPPTREFTPPRTPIPTNQIGPVVGLFAPDFNLTELASGKQVTLAQYVGQPVFIFFWATWCLHCNNEMGSIETISQTNKAAGLVVLTVNAADDLATVTLYRTNHNLTVPILLDPNSIFKNAYNISLDSIPLHFFIDSNGKIRSIFKGELTLAELQSYLSTILQPLPTSTP